MTTPEKINARKASDTRLRNAAADLKNADPASANSVAALRAVVVDLVETVDALIEASPFVNHTS